MSEEKLKPCPLCWKPVADDGICTNEMCYLGGVKLHDNYYITRAEPEPKGLEAVKYYNLWKIAEKGLPPQLTDDPDALRLWYHKQMHEIEQAKLGQEAIELLRRVMDEAGDGHSGTCEEANCAWHQAESLLAKVDKG